VPAGICAWQHNILGTREDPDEKVVQSISDDGDVGNKENRGSDDESDDEDGEGEADIDEEEYEDDTDADQKRINFRRWYEEKLRHQL
jgi:hypothetical protein